MKASASIALGVAAAAAAVNSASAFTSAGSFAGARVAGARSSTSASTSALQMASLEKVIGGKGFGKDGPAFDPLGLANKASPLELKKYQESEIKHGRVAMLASVGYLVQESFHPFFTQNPQADIGPALIHFQYVSSVAPKFWLAAIFAIGIFEAANIGRGWQKQNPFTEGVAPLYEDYIAGDINFDPLGLAPLSDMENFEEMRRKELNNGRLAMIAIIGFWGQELVDGKPIFDNHLPF